VEVEGVVAEAVEEEAVEVAEAVEEEAVEAAETPLKTQSHQPQESK
jgi:hypothetical protein